MGPLQAMDMFLFGKKMGCRVKPGNDELRE